MFSWRDKEMIDFYCAGNGVYDGQNKVNSTGNTWQSSSFSFLCLFCLLFQRLLEFLILISKSICSLTSVRCLNKANKHLYRLVKFSIEPISRQNVGQPYFRPSFKRCMFYLNHLLAHTTHATKYKFNYSQLWLVHLFFFQNSTYIYCFRNPKRERLSS